MHEWGDSTAVGEVWRRPVLQQVPRHAEVVVVNGQNQRRGGRLLLGGEVVGTLVEDGRPKEQGVGQRPVEADVHHGSLLEQHLHPDAATED